MQLVVIVGAPCCVFRRRVDAASGFLRSCLIYDFFDTRNQNEHEPIASHTNCQSHSVATDSHCQSVPSSPTTLCQCQALCLCPSPRTAAGHKNDDNFVLYFLWQSVAASPAVCPAAQVRPGAGGDLDCDVGGGVVSLMGGVRRQQICLLLVTFLNNFYCCKSQCQLLLLLSLLLHYGLNFTAHSGKMTMKNIRN